jgi:hypothetical protein
VRQQQGKPNPPVPGVGPEARRIALLGLYVEGDYFGPTSTCWSPVRDDLADSRIEWGADRSTQKRTVRQSYETWISQFFSKTVSDAVLTLMGSEPAGRW